ncbi:MAG: YgiQ family radical SAM protein [Oscillospiraceae bacterium]|nr:YgiQ family radical SAM protein [Oscillospiraceae bacterium]
MSDFLPTSKQDMLDRSWYWYDFLLVTGDAYVDHPSFGAAIIGRLLEAEGYRVAVLAQPDWHSAEAFAAFGRPKLGVLIGAGNLDSMVAHYTAAKKPRSEDFYSPGKRAGLRPDRATIVYANRAREAFGSGCPIVIGGLEASLRRFAHYDYWDDTVRRCILSDSGADLLVYGMGERATKEIAARLKKKKPVDSITDVPGTAYLTTTPENCAFPSLTLPSFEAVRDDRRAYAEATRIEYAEHDPIRGRALLQAHGSRTLVVNPPALPLNTRELDAVAELPYARSWHPTYDAQGGVPALEEVLFSITNNRGCFGGCSFCALAFHQGRMVTARSADSVVREVTAFTKDPRFKGYVSDVGGPTANFDHYSCKKQETCGMCPDRNCLSPTPCPNLDADESNYLKLLRRLREIPGVKKVFVRSGVRYDYMLCDKDRSFFSDLVRHHVSGQLRVAPEHCVDRVLDYMGKPPIGVYEKFLDQYRRLNQRYEKEQFAVPYLMSSHPGSTLDDAIELAVYLNRQRRQPEQVQDFYPTPGTLSTCMYHTGLDPRTMQPVYVPRSEQEKRMQRALLQWRRPELRETVIAALKKAGRTDLIGYGPDCLVRPRPPKKPEAAGKGGAKAAPPQKKAAPPQKKTGWAKAKPKPNARPKSGAKPTGKGRGAR